MHRVSKFSVPVGFQLISFGLALDVASVLPTPSSATPSAPSSSAGTSSRSQALTSVASCAKLKRKEPTGERSGSAPKKTKLESESESESESRRLTLAPEIQAGFYGLELMRARWNRTHAIVILLIGRCIKSISIATVLNYHDAFQAVNCPSTGLTRKDASEPTSSTSSTSSLSSSP